MKVCYHNSLEYVYCTILIIIINKGFDKKSLKISLVSGEVKLKNLQLQKSALDDLNLPIKVKFGMYIHMKNILF